MLLRFIMHYIIMSKKGEDCIYLIPENFEGNILIVYDQ